MNTALAIILALLALTGFCQILFVMGPASHNINLGEITIEGRAKAGREERVINCVKKICDDLPFDVSVRIILENQGDSVYNQKVVQIFGDSAQVMREDFD